MDYIKRSQAQLFCIENFVDVENDNGFSIDLSIAQEKNNRQLTDAA